MNTSKDAGTIFVLLDRLNNHRLPRAMQLKEKVDRGETLGTSDKAFLKRVIDESKGMVTLIDRHPEYQELVAKMTSLYSDITSKGLENEKKARG